LFRRWVNAILLRSARADAVPPRLNRTNSSAIAGNDVNHGTNGHERTAQRLNDVTVGVLSAICDDHSLVGEGSRRSSICGVVSADNCNARRVRSSNGVVFQPD